jgi:hypothetical protein
VILSTVLIVFTTLVNAYGVKLMSRINSAGVFIELVAAVLLVILLAVNVSRGPNVLFETQGKGAGHDWGYFGAFLVGALASAYVMYGFDTASSLGRGGLPPYRRHGRSSYRRIRDGAGSIAMYGATMAEGTRPGGCDLLRGSARVVYRCGAARRSARSMDDGRHALPPRGVGTPSELWSCAISASVAPVARSPWIRRATGSVTAGGRPSCTPAARFIASASRVRCPMRLRSSCANVAMTLAIASPAGVVVSTAQSRATSAQPSRRACSMRAAKSITDRDRRSSFATTSAPLLLALSFETAAWMGGRLRSRPDHPASSWMPARRQPRPLAFRGDRGPLGREPGSSYGLFLRADPDVTFALHRGHLLGASPRLLAQRGGN